MPRCRLFIIIFSMPIDVAIADAATPLMFRCCFRFLSHTLRHAAAFLRRAGCQRY